MYLTYAEYQNMGGALDETTFSNYEFEAESIINWYTFNRLKQDITFPEEVKRCAFYLINIAKLKADAMSLGAQTITTTTGTSETTITTSPTIASQSNDGVSISYNTVSASEAFNALTLSTKGNEIEMAVKRYLQGVVNSLGRKVLYRGVYPDE